MPRGRQGAKNARRSHVQREGEAITVRTYEFGAEDRHGDAPSVETANSPYENVAAVYRLTGTAVDAPTTERGEDLVYDLAATLRDDAAPLADGVFAGNAESRPNSRLEVAGQTFIVLRYIDTGTGTVDVLARLA